MIKAYSINQHQVLNEKMSESVECPICFGEMDVNDCATTSCGHKFHTSCLFHNMKFNGESCPYCRGNFIGKKTANTRCYMPTKQYIRSGYYRSGEFIFPLNAEGICDCYAHSEKGLKRLIRKYYGTNRKIYLPVESFIDEVKSLLMPLAQSMSDENKHYHIGQKFKSTYGDERAVVDKINATNINDLVYDLWTTKKFEFTQNEKLKKLQAEEEN